jgi:hypothetical protein
LWWVFFKIESQELFAPGWLPTKILLISASCVAGITGVSHQCHGSQLTLKLSESHFPQL